MVDRDYQQLHKHFLSIGMPKEQADSHIAKEKAEDAKIDALECPRCSSTLIRQTDGRQAGASSVPGQWALYRCANCQWMLDRKEPLE